MTRQCFLPALHTESRAPRPARASKKLYPDGFQPLTSPLSLHLSRESDRWNGWGETGNIIPAEHRFIVIISMKSMRIKPLAQRRFRPAV
jgi:hypothetical protein